MNAARGQSHAEFPASGIWDRSDPCRFHPVAHCLAFVLSMLWIFHALTAVFAFTPAQLWAAIGCGGLALVCAVAAWRWGRRRSARYDALYAEADRRWSDDGIRSIVAAEREDVASVLRTAARRAAEAGFGPDDYWTGKADGRDAFELAVGVVAWRRLSAVARSAAARIPWLDGPAPVRPLEQRP